LLSVGLITGTMQIFEIPLMMTGGGPLHSTQTPMLFLNTFNSRGGRPANAVLAGAFLVMIVLTALNMILFYSIRSNKAADA